MHLAVWLRGFGMRYEGGFSPTPTLPYWGGCRFVINAGLGGKDFGILDGGQNG